MGWFYFYRGTHMIYPEREDAYHDIALVHPTTADALRTVVSDAFSGVVAIHEVVPRELPWRQRMRRQEAAIEDYATYARQRLGAQALDRQIYVELATRQLSHGMRMINVAAVAPGPEGQAAVRAVWEAATALQATQLLEE